MNNSRTKVKHALYKFTAYDATDIDILNELCVGHDVYKLEMEEIRDCGCWNSCNCCTWKVVLYGFRDETDEEQEMRMQKYKDAERTRSEAIRDKELAELKRLNDKYNQK